MKSYIPNNINFRIVSSNALAKFKNDQAYDFNEIKSKPNTYSAAAREVVLLEYDHWFKWIVKLEKVFLLLSEYDKADALSQKTCVLLQAEMDDIHEVMSVYTDFFSSDLTNFISSIHRYSTEALKSSIEYILNNHDIFSAFSKIVHLISLYLQQILISLEEYELVYSAACNFKTNDNIILYYSDWSKEIEGCGESICPSVERARYYKTHFSVNNFVVTTYNNNEEISDHGKKKIQEEATKHSIQLTFIESA